MYPSPLSHMCCPRRTSLLYRAIMKWSPITGQITSPHPRPYRKRQTFERPKSSTYTMLSRHLSITLQFICCIFAAAVQNSFPRVYFRSSSPQSSLPHLVTPSLLHLPYGTTPGRPGSLIPILALHNCSMYVSIAAKKVCMCMPLHTRAI